MKVFVLSVGSFGIGQRGTGLFRDIRVFIGADPGMVRMYRDFGFVGRMWPFGCFWQSGRYFRGAIWQGSLHTVKVAIAVPAGGSQTEELLLC